MQVGALTKRKIPRLPRVVPPVSTNGSAAKGSPTNGLPGPKGQYPSPSSPNNRHCWVERIRDGDEQAFEELFHAFYPRLCAFAVTYVGSYDAARDVVQDVFLKIWKRRTRWRLHTSLKSYLYQAVRNQSLNHRKSEQRRRDREQASRPGGAALAAEDEVLRKELGEAIWAAIDQLPPRRRRAFVLHRQHGLTYKEVAQVMGTQPKTVENQIGRALKFLRKELSPEYF